MGEQAGVGSGETKQETTITAQDGRSRETVTMLLPDVLGAPLGCAAALFGVGLLSDRVLIDYERRRGRTHGLPAFGVALVVFGALFAGGPALTEAWPSAGGPLTAGQALAAVLVIWLWFAGRPADTRRPLSTGRREAAPWDGRRRNSASGPIDRRAGGRRPR